MNFYRNVMYISLQHAGILLTILGTIFLAFSVRVKGQYNKEIRKDIGKDPSILSPTEVCIVRIRFWAGLACVAAGSLLQW